MYQINIFNNQKVFTLGINLDRLRRVLKCILRKERGPSGLFNFIFVDNREIRRLNRRYLGRNRITDVIAFPLADNCDNIKGEVVVSVEEARRQSRRRNIPLNDEIALYCIHGLLHLIGYDDLAESERIKMERRQSEYLKMMAATSSVPRAGRRGFRRRSS
ncbi:MAG: rRNA maturation RNase YbeY [Planctomycetota bacterium]